MPVSRAESGFPVIHVEEEADWDLLGQASDGTLKQREINQFRGMLGSWCRTIVVERDYFCKDYRDTYTNYYAKKFAAYPGKCLRLLFFRDPMPECQWWSWWDDEDHRRSFLGYSVIRPTKVRCVGRTVLDPRFVPGFRVTFAGASTART